MPHPSPDCAPDCYGCKLRSIQFGNVEAPAERVMEQRMERDLPAYRRLRANGLQPKTTKNCAELETRAHSQREIEIGGLVEPKLLRQYESRISEGMAASRDLGFSTSDVAGWKKVG